MSAWPRARLGDCAEIISGSTPKTSVGDFWDGDVYWATPKDLSDLDGHVITSTSRTITAAGLGSCGASVLPSGSVLFSSRAPIGLVAVNTIPMATNQGFKSFVPRPNLLVSGYLAHWLRANRKYLDSLGNGATFKEVSKATVSRVEIPLPPVPEQQRIAEVLDRADALRANRREALALLEELTQSIFLDMFGRHSSRTSWPLDELQSVVRKGTLVTYGIVQAGDEVEGGVPYIRTGDLVDGGIRLDGLRHTAPEIASKFQRSTVVAGDLVISIRATVGTTAMVPAVLTGANLTQGTARIAPGDRVSPRYLLEYLRSADVQSWIKQQIKGATFLEITLGRLRELQVLLPPMELQEAFDERMRERDRLRAAGRMDLCRLDDLFAALQQRAFAGEL